MLFYFILMDSIASRNFLSVQVKQKMTLIPAFYHEK
jgi:hypothetical protein